MPWAIQLFIMLINCGFQGGKDIRVLEVPITWRVKIRAPISWLAMRWSSFLPQELESSTICRQEFCMPSVLCAFQVKSSRFQRFSEESVPFETSWWDSWGRVVWILTQHGSPFQGKKSSKKHPCYSLVNRVSCRSKWTILKWDSLCVVWHPPGSFLNKGNCWLKVTLVASTMTALCNLWRVRFLMRGNQSFEKNLVDVLALERILDD